MQLIYVDVQVGQKEQEGKEKQEKDEASDRTKNAWDSFVSSTRGAPVMLQ